MRLATMEEIMALPYSEPFQDGSLTLFYTSTSDQFMQKAKAAIVCSTDHRHPTAAVVVKDDAILMQDANQSGFKNPWLIRVHELGWCVRRFLRIKSGTHYWLCPGCAKSYDHAESRAARTAADKYPDRVNGATLYLYGHFWCCQPCCEAMVRAGVKEVVLLEGAYTAFK